MGSMDWHSSHSPPTFSGHVDVVEVTNANLSSVSAKVNADIEPQTVTSTGEDHLFPPSSCANNASCSSIEEDDSSHATIAGRSSLNNDSDCETIATTASRCIDENYTTALALDCRNSSTVPSVCISGSTSSLNSGVGKSKFDRMNEANASDVDKLLVDELQGLSALDRGMVQEEIHGVSTCAVSEDDGKIVEGMKCLEEKIRAIRREVLVNPDQVSNSGNAYSESIWAYLAVEEEMSSAANCQKRLLYSYIFHRDFRLKFLRADLYDVEKAAHRYLRCVECLLNYFGSYALQRPLVFEDLGKECQDVAKAGYVQILPSRDRARRLVVVCQSAIQKSTETTMATVVKLFTYIFQVVSEDVETQKRGVIFVFSSDEDGLQMISNPSAKKEYRMYREGSPVRRSCTHFCLPENNPKMRTIRAVLMLAMPQEELVRTRIHMDGLTTETQYKLMTFGIPVSELPITSTGAIKTKHHIQWIKTRKAIDASRIKSLEECYNNKIQQQQEQKQQHLFCMDFCTYPPTYDEFLKHHGNEPIIHPMINDVLFSKGGKNVTHYGNIEFTDLMKRSLMEYVSGTPVQNRKMRKAIRQTIVDEVQARGGRFLTLDKKLPGGYCWTEIEKGPDLHDRIATSLYDHKRRLAAKLKVKTNRSGATMFMGVDNSKRRKVATDDGQSIPDGSICGHEHVRKHYIIDGII